MKQFKGFLQGTAVFLGSLALLFGTAFALNLERSWVYQLINAPLMLELSVLSALIVLLLWTGRQRSS